MKYSEKMPSKVYTFFDDEWADRMRAKLANFQFHFKPMPVFKNVPDTINKGNDYKQLIKE